MKFVAALNPPRELKMTRNQPILSARAIEALLLSLFLLGSPRLSISAEPPAAPPPPPVPPLTATPGVQGPSKTGTLNATPTREELQKLTPAEREARIQQLKEKVAVKMKDGLTPAEREKRRQVIVQRLQHRLEILHNKQKAGPLTPEEQQSLKRLEELSKNFQHSKLEGGLTPAEKKKKD